VGGVGVLPLYMFKSSMKTGGVFIAGSSLVLGVIGLASSYLGTDGIIFNSIGGLFLSSLLIAAYLESRKPKMFLAIGPPFYALILTFIFSLPLLILFETLSLEVGILVAYQLSSLDLLAISKVRSEDKWIRATLLPFLKFSAVIDRIVHGGRRAREVRLFSYSLFPILIAILIAAVWFVRDAAVVAYALTIVSGFTFAIASNRFPHVES